MSNRVTPEPQDGQHVPDQQQQQFEADLQHFIAQQQPEEKSAPAPEPHQPEKLDDVADLSMTEVQNISNIAPPEASPGGSDGGKGLRKRRHQKPTYPEAETSYDNDSKNDNDTLIEIESDNVQAIHHQGEPNGIDSEIPPYTPAPPALLPPLEPSGDEGEGTRAEASGSKADDSTADQSSAYPSFQQAAGAPYSRRYSSTMSQPRNSGIKDAGVIGANEATDDSGCCAIILTVLSYILVVLFFPLSLCATIKVVQEYERAVIFRLGRLLPGGAKGPGIFFVMPCIEEYTKVDLRTVSFDVPPQEVLTRDSVTVSVDAVVYYRISNPTVSVANVENAANSTQLLAQTTLRNVLGTQNLAEILSNREHISEQMQNALDDATDKWGIKVERVEIKDVRLPTQLQRAMAAEAEAARDARAKVIAAEGEQKASAALKEAADIIANSPAALQLRYLQTLTSISAEKNSTIIFPLPIEMVQGLLKK